MDTYIRRWYEPLRGNVNGLPFLHVGVNITAYDLAQQQTEEFIDDFGLSPCANDYNSDPESGLLQTNAVHDLFQSRFLRPVILVINCVSNSTSHPQWALLLNQGGGQADWNVAISQWRAAIDSVQAPPPRLTNLSDSAGVLQFTFPGQRGRTNRVECTTNFVNWTVLTNVFGTNAPIIFRETDALSNAQRFYRVRRL